VIALQKLVIFRVHMESANTMDLERDIFAIAHTLKIILAFFTSGFQGIACETKFVNCQDENRRNWRCYNDAVCGYDVGCVCNSDDFTGKFCEIPSNGFSYDNILPKSEESRKGNMLLRIIFGILLSISPCFVLVSALVQRRKNASQGNFSKLEDVKVADCEVTKGEII